MHTIVHIGWPKTATSWLQDKVFVEDLGYLQPLPRQEIIRSLVLPDQMAFDAARVRSALVNEVDRIRGQGLVPVLSHERLSGVLRNRLESVVFGERLIAVVPGIKVFVVLREQRGAMVASWQQYIRDGGAPATGPSVKSLHSYYGDEQTRSSTMPPVGDFRYFEYDRLVRWYVERLGRSHVLALPLERLRDDPVGFYSCLCEFSGVDPGRTPDFSASNEAWAPLTYQVKRLLNYAGDRRRYADTSTPSMYQSVMSASYKLDQLLPGWVRHLGRDRARSTVDELVRDHFIASNRRLQQLVTWDLRDYGYMV